MVRVLLLLTHYYFGLHLITKGCSFRLNRSSLMGLLTITESTLNGFGFKRNNSDSINSSKKISNPFSYFLGTKQIRLCPKMDTIGDRLLNEYLQYPEFHKIHLRCLMRFKENKTCHSTCILAAIINHTDYGDQFLKDIDDGNDIYRSKSAGGFQTHKNIFCYSKEYRSTVLNNLITCKLLHPARICIVDGNPLRCHSSLGNCNFDENEAFAFTTGNLAHRFTCGTLDQIHWKYFENSSIECILPESKILLNLKRYIFKNCNVCSSHKMRGKFGNVTEYSWPPTKEEFAQIPYSSLPIVIRNGAITEGMLPLNFSLVKQIYEDFDVEIERKCTFAQFTMNAPFESLAHAFSLITDETPLGYDWYIGWEVCNPEVGKKFRKIIPKPSFLPGDSLPSVNLPWIVAGSPGSGVFDHVDHVNKPIWQAQLAGHKKWYLRAPPECHHVCSKLFIVTVNQGDLLLLHNNAWHHMTVVEKSNLSITYGTSYDFKEN